MIKKVVCLIVELSLLTALSACSSSEVKETKDSQDRNDKYSSSGQSSTASADVESVGESEKSIPEVKRDEKIAMSQYALLDEAIKTQNDSSIQKYSSDILTQNSKDQKALNALAMVYYKKSRYDAAFYLLNKSLNANANSSETNSNLGLVLLAKNEKREAIKSFKKALEIDSFNGVAAANLGSIYTQEKAYGKAAMALEIAVKNGIYDYKVMSNYAIALSATGKTKEAANLYEKLIKENPGQKDIMLNYSILLIEEMQKYKEGLDLLSRLKFVGMTEESRPIIKDLENKAKAGLQ